MQDFYYKVKNNKDDFTKSEKIYSPANKSEYNKVYADISVIQLYAYKKYINGRA